MDVGVDGVPSRPNLPATLSVPAKVLDEVPRPLAFDAEPSGEVVSPVVRRHAPIPLRRAVLRPEVLLPDVVDVRVVDLLPARLRQEQPRAAVVGTAQQVLEKDPSEFVIQREDARSLRLVPIPVVRDVDRVLPSLQGWVRPQVLVVVLKFRVGDMDFTQFNVRRFRRAYPQFELGDDDGAVPNVLDLADGIA
mgnify:CR=1 FL=1